MGAKNQLPISRWYIDAGWSGRTFNRPEFQKLIADIELGDVDCVVVKDHDQLVPDPISSITVRKIFDLAANGTGVYRDAGTGQGKADCKGQP